jgi:hypothetical protein
VVEGLLGWLARSDPPQGPGDARPRPAVTGPDDTCAKHAVSAGETRRP